MVKIWLGSLEGKGVISKNPKLRDLREDEIVSEKLPLWSSLRHEHLVAEGRLHWQADPQLVQAGRGRTGYPRLARLA